MENEATSRRAKERKKRIKKKQYDQKYKVIRNENIFLKDPCIMRIQRKRWGENGFTFTTKTVKGESKIAQGICGKHLQNLSLTP